MLENTSDAIGTLSSLNSIGDLNDLTDEELLDYINCWDEEESDSQNIVDTFQSIFETHIITDNHRLSFWLQNRTRIHHMVYVKAIVEGLTTKIYTQCVFKLEDLIEFCDWVLSLSDTSTQRGKKEQCQLTSVHPDLEPSRKAVVTFIDGCMSNHVPISARDGIARLLAKVCNQFDTRLGNNSSGYPNVKSQLNKGLNNSRSYGLKVLINFGDWVRRQVPNDTVPEVTDILSKRIIEPAKIPLTEPEYAILGQNFRRLYDLNPEWTSQHRKLIFPRENKSNWKCSFGSYLCYNPPMEFLMDEYDYALENLQIFNHDNDQNENITNLGMGVFYLYLQKVYDLTSENSLLNKFYTKTYGHPKLWGFLFFEVGRSLIFSPVKEYKDRAVDFLNWRLEVGQSQELHNFYGWLESKYLEPSLRLNSYLKILNLPWNEHLDNLIDMRTLIILHEKEELLVVKCLAKIAELFPHLHYFSTSELRKLVSILQASQKSNNSEIKESAKLAMENFRKSGMINHKHFPQNEIP